MFVATAHGRSGCFLFLLSTTLLTQCQEAVCAKSGRPLFPLDVTGGLVLALQSPLRVTACLCSGQETRKWPLNDRKNRGEDVVVAGMLECTKHLDLHSLGDRAQCVDQKCGL